jgi:hypothetical protein
MGDVKKTSLKRTSTKETEANMLFKEALQKSREATEDMLELGRLLKRLQHRDLWRHITENGVQRFRQWSELAECVFPSISRRKCYELINAFSLTHCENSIAPDTVRKMGVKRASEVARLPASLRTPEIIALATTKPVMLVRNRVQQILNQHLPKDEQKPMLKLLAINLPEEYVTEFEELIELLGHTDGARDGDSTQTIRYKAFKLMLIGAAEYWAQEIGAVLGQMKAEAAIHDSPAGEAQENPDFPDEEEFADVPKPREGQQALLRGLRTNE